MKRVVITGIGVVCGNAGNKEEFAQAVFFGKSGIKKCAVFDTNGLLTPYFGQADSIEDKNRFYVLLKKSADEMMTDAKISMEYLSSLGRKCRMFLGSLLYSSDAYYTHSKAKREHKECDSLAHMNDYSAYAKKITGVQGEVFISSAACASGTAAAGMALDFIRNGICDCAVVGGVDSLSIIAAYGFNALKSLSRGVCNPYDMNRDGINLGECGAFLFLESLGHALARNANIYCELTGYALGNDAYHITSPEPNGIGAYNTMLSAVNDAGILAGDIDYINGHGTGTQINDSMEIKAAEKLIAGTDKKILLSSTKSMIGHCMGASGVVELISVILSMQYGKYIPLPNLKNTIGDSDNIKTSDKTFDTDIEYSLSNSFAFAGNSASVVVKKYHGGEAE